MNRQTATQTKPTTSPLSNGILQRKCASCDQHTIAGKQCAECSQKKQVLQRRATNQNEVGEVPPIVHEVLNSPGQPLDPETRTFMEPRFGHDFSGVRVHADAKSTESARAVNALAYTVGQDVVFSRGGYAPDTNEGKKLLAHELTHVIQQKNISNQSSFEPLTIDQSDSVSETEAQRIGASVLTGGLTTSGNTPIRTYASATAPIISRADTDAVGYTMRLGRTARTGIQFSPTNVTDTQVGLVTVQGGLLSSRANRLNVIIGENLSLRALARQLLPLWITATPFTPPGAVAPLPLDIITVDELAQGLLVYNQTYLPVPAMTNWRSGLRFPLPVEINELTGVATLHPLQIRALAGGFDPAWLPLLDLRASATVAAPAATLQPDVTAFLGRETTTLARGIHLGARALTNAVAELPFIREVFRQLGAASFDVALAFMDNLVNRDISLLAAQRDGAAILAEIRTALAVIPAILTPNQQTSLDRANLMLGLIAGVVAQAPPGATRTLAEKVIAIDTLKLDGSTHNPATDVAMADAILSQCNVRVRHGLNVTATNAQTIAWLGNTDLHSGNNCASPSAEERALFQDASATLGFNARFRAFFPSSVSGINASGYSCPPSDSPAALFRNKIVVENSGDTATLAHELGHILIDLGPHTAVGLMSPRPALPAMRLPQVSNPHCTRLYDNA